MTYIEETATEGIPTSSVEQVATKVALPMAAASPSEPEGILLALAKSVASQAESAAFQSLQSTNNLLGSAEGTATAGAAASPNDPAPTPTSAGATKVDSATATASSFTRYTPALPPEGPATVRDREWIIDKLAYPATGRRPFDFMLSLDYFTGLQEAMERRVFFNEIGGHYPSSLVSQIIQEKNANVHTALQSVSEEYRLYYLKLVELDHHLSASKEDLFNLDRNYQALRQVSDKLGSFESQTVKLVKEYGENSQVVFRGFFDKVKELDITKKNWGDDLALIPASDQLRVRNSILIETERQASFNGQPRILTLDRRDLFTLNKAPISKIQSLCNDRLKIATRTSIFDLSSSEVKLPSARFYQISNQIRRIFAELRSENFKDIKLVEDELQWRIVEVGKIKQELKRIG